LVKKILIVFKYYFYLKKINLNPIARFNYQFQAVKKILIVFKYYFYLKKNNLNPIARFNYQFQAKPVGDRLRMRKAQMT
jgi:hypothetical protein